MARFRTLLSKFLALVGIRHRDADLSEEIQSHLDALAAGHMRNGLTPHEARAAARREFGGVEQMKELYRDQRGLGIVDALRLDLRDALRTIRRTPGFAAVVVLTFGLGIGATAAVYAVVNGVLLRPLPYPNANRIVQVVQLLPVPPMAPGVPRKSRSAGLTFDQLRAWRDNTKTIAHMAKYGVLSATLTGAGDAVRLNGASVSPGFFELLGVRPLVGRTFAPEEEEPNAPPTVILSYDTWSKYFGRSATVIDGSVTLNGTLRRVVGIMPREFDLPALPGTLLTRTDTGRLGASPEFWLPSPLPPPTVGPVSGSSIAPVIASLRPGVTLAQATAEAEVMVPPRPNGRARLSVGVVNVRDEMVRSVRPVILTFQIAVLFVLLIACANVMNLFLSRASRRRRELGIRMALGAGRRQIMRHTIVESVLLGLLGGCVGVLLAFVVVRLLGTLPPDTLPRLDDVRVDIRVVGFAFAMCVLAGSLVGFFVAVRGWRKAPLYSLRDDAAPASFLGRQRPSPVLVVFQTTAAIVLLAGAGLLLNSFVRLARTDYKFDSRNLLTFSVTPTWDRYPVGLARASFYDRLAGELRAVPGVTSVAVGSSLPFFSAASISSFPLTVGGRPAEGMVTYSVAMPGYFQALGINVVRGREFATADSGGAVRPIIVNQTFVDRFIGSDEPLGQAVQFKTAPPYQIVGVVSDTVRGTGLKLLDTPSFPEIFFRAQDQPEDGAVATIAVGVRATNNPLGLLPSVRRAVARVDPTVPVYNAALAEQLLSESTATTTLYALAAAMFGGVAVFLAVVGLYGVLAYAVSSRTHEFGVRMALGSDAARIVRGVVRQGLLLVGAGVVLGLGGAFLATSALGALLFGLTPRDPATFVAVAALFVAVAFLACYIPARRASRVDPMVALRCE